jgi:hypothetical protein
MHPDEVEESAAFGESSQTGTDLVMEMRFKINRIMYGHFKHRIAYKDKKWNTKCVDRCYTKYMNKKL